MSHILRNQQASGHGKWKECISCGAAIHGGYWWYAGFKSKAEPPCTPYKIDTVWQAQAERSVPAGS